MAFWENPLLRKTLVFMIAGLIGLAAIVSTSLWLSDRADDNAGEVIQERQIRTQAASLLGLLRDAETGQRGFLLTSERRYLEPYERSAPAVPGSLERLKQLAATTPRIATDIARLSDLVASKMDELGRTIALASDGHREEALDIVRGDTGISAMQGLRDLLGGLVIASDARVAALLNQGQAATAQLFWVTALSSLLIVLLAGAAGWTVTRYTRELVEARSAVVAANLGLEDRVAERTADLARANEEIQRFAYIVSHDLRAPLVNIVGFTSEMETGVQALQRFVEAATVPEEQATLANDARTAATDDLPEAVGFIRASTTKMDRLINAILKLSREGRRELRPEPIDLKTLFAAAASSVQHQLDQKDARIDVGERMPTVVSDRLALEQIFGNLIDNAVKYFAPGRAGHIKINAESRGPTVTVELIDNGRGIATADHERIFELFRRSGTQNVPGEGIGLANVRALVRRLGGDITVESELGRGSTFRVSIPRVLARRAEGKS